MMQRGLWRTIRAARMGLLLAGVYVSLVSQPLPAWGSTPWVVGDVFVGVSNGAYQVYDNAGVFKETISHPTLSGFTTGCAFNPALDGLYTTYIFDAVVVAYDDPSPHSVAQTIPDPDGGFNESIVFAANGDFYVGHPGGNVIHQYDATGTLITTHAVASAGIGTDWIDLATNQTTLFYTGEGRVVKRFDTVVGQLTDFAALPSDGGTAFALRLLPPGDGSGGLLVADRSEIKRLDSTGAVVQTYDVSIDVLDENCWFALNLDPNGTSFWSGDFCTANFYRFNINTGAIEVGPINTGTGSDTLFGLCVKGERTAAQTAGLDHFKCYEAAGKTVKRTVQLKDQFDVELQQVKVGKPELFCNPVAKTVDGEVTKIGDPTAHLTCYQIKDRDDDKKRRVDGDDDQTRRGRVKGGDDDQTRHVRVNNQKRLVQVNNQFGEQTLTVDEPKNLCVPSEKNGEGFPQNLDHFKCYEAKGAPVNVTVDLEDQFGVEPQVLVGKPKLFCNPVAKTVDGEVTEIGNPKAHLTCYDIEDGDDHEKRHVHARHQFGEQSLKVHEPKRHIEDGDDHEKRRVRVKNQFFDEQEQVLKVDEPKRLCVPSEKISFEPVPDEDDDKDKDKH